MGRLIRLLVVVCYAKICCAQVYQPFPTDSSNWRQASATWFLPVYEQWDYNYFFQGDTVLSGQTYHKIYRTGTYAYYTVTMPFMIHTLTMGPYLTTDTYVGGIKEDGAKKIYFYPDTATVSSEQLLYDFNLTVGDTLPVDYNNNSYALGANVVSSIDSVLLGTNYHKRFNISMPSAPNYVSLIEGVGSTFGLLEMLVPTFESASRLHCFTREGALLYKDSVAINAQVYTITTCALPSPVGINVYLNETQISLVPNPTSGIVNIKTSFSEKVQIEIYDLFGNRIYQLEQQGMAFTIDLSHHPKGVYFLKVQSGNKISKTKKIVLQ
jgi:hypothetical protein